MGLSESDIKRLDAATEGHRNRGIDPADIPPDIPKPIGKDLSKKIAEYAEEHSRRQAAEYFGLEKATVDAHSSVWRDDLDYSREIQFEGGTAVTERMCTMMRVLVDDGLSLRGAANKFDVAYGTAHRHVSSSESCQHDDQIDIGRVSLQHGGRHEISSD